MREESRRRNSVWRERNKEKKRQQSEKWRLKNPDKIRKYAADYRADKLRATPKWLSSEHWDDINLAYNVAVELEGTTGIKYHVDHITPLRGENVCGLHVPWNLQAIPACENFRKSNKHDD